MEEADWKTRVRLEHADLVERLTKLRAFFAEERDITLQPVDRNLLRKQRSIMVKYELILSDRIARFGYFPDE